MEILGFSIESVNAGWELTHQAAIFKSRGGLSYADCYTAALAKLRQAQVITGDPEIKNLRGDIKIYWQAD